jgi:hypothetical protein
MSPGASGHSETLIGLVPEHSIKMMAKKKNLKREKLARGAIFFFLEERLGHD